MQKTGVGIRVLNFLVDTFLIFGITYAASAWWDFHVMYWHYPSIQFYTMFFIMLFIYYTIFESIFKRSPGKWLSKSKVANSKGGKPAFWQILVRSLVRLTIIDCFFIPFFDGPLHDYLSKTTVIEA